MKVKNAIILDLDASRPGQLGNLVVYNKGLYQYNFEVTEEARDKLGWDTIVEAATANLYSMLMAEGPIKKEEVVVETKTFFGLFPENYEVVLDEDEPGEAVFIGRGVYRISVQNSIPFVNVTLKDKMGVRSVGILRVSDLQDGGIYNATFGSSKITVIKIKQII